ncbi:MAG: MFS transporter [Asticcacaulis sp.]
MSAARDLWARIVPHAALIALFGAVFMNLVGFGILVPLLPFFAKSLAADPWQVTLMFSAYSLGQFFAEPLWGRLSDRIGRKPVLVVTTGSNVLFYVLLAFVPDITWAIVIRFLSGLGAGNISTIQGYVADVTPPEQRAGRMGLIGAAFALGFIVGPAIGGFLVQEGAGQAGFRLPLFVAAGMASLACLGVVAFVRESRVHHDRPQPDLKQAIVLARRHPVIGRVILTTLCYMGAFAGMESTFGLWAEARYGWHAFEISLLFVTVGVTAALVQTLVTGRLARRFGEARVLAFGMLVFGGSFLIQSLNGFVWLVAPIVAIGTFGQALTFPNTAALISRSSAPDQQGAMLGLNMASGAGARILGPLIAGVLFSAFGPNAPLLFGAVLTLPAAWMALSAGRAFERQQREREFPNLP